MNSAKFLIPAFRRFFAPIFTRKFFIGAAFCALALAAVMPWRILWRSGAANGLGKLMRGRRNNEA